MADIVSSELPKTATYVDVLKQQAPETAKTLQRYIDSTTEGLAAGLIGNSPDFQEKTLKALRGFSDGAFVRGASENLRKPELTITALNGAGALLSPEPNAEGEQAAREMIDALRRRYSTLR